jgi:hypothetical protein
MPVFQIIVPGDQRAGNGISKPVRTLVQETIPLVSGPLGNS